MKGIVSICKVFKDGRREPVIQESCNVLTDGFGMSVASMLSTGPDQLAERFHFKYFQVGVSGYYQYGPINNPIGADPYVEIDKYSLEKFSDALPHSTHNNFYELSSALTDASSYGTGNLKTVTKEVLTVTNPFVQQSDLEYTTSSMLLVELPDHPCTNLTDRSVNFKLTIDTDSLNGVAMREIGLFA